MQPNSTTHQDELLAKLENLEKTLTDWDKKYLHLKSVHNFIIHLSDIKNAEDETWVYNSLRTYLKDCSDLTFELDRTKSDHVYVQYLDKIGNYYSRHLNFSMIASNRMLQVFSLLIVLMAYFFTGIWIALILLLFFIYRRHFIYNKKKQNKVYGLFY